jgi:hypothetical protein
MAPVFHAGDHVRLAPSVRLRGYSTGETGTVVRLVLRPHSDEVAGYVVRLDREGQGALVTFYPGELEPTQ